MRMKRNVIEALAAWKNSEDRKPMVLKGVRQVGKTWLMKELGKDFYGKEYDPDLTKQTRSDVA